MISKGYVPMSKTQFSVDGDKLVKDDLGTLL